MNVRVVFFASLREAVGEDATHVVLDTGGYAELREQLVARFGASADALWADNVRLARNQELHAGAANELQLADGDEVAFLPPVTGG